VNQTLFDRFAAETGVTMDCFDTFEGIAAAATTYAAWTDAQTPEIPRDARQFYTADSWGNLAQSGMLQLGGNLFDGESLALDNPAYRHIWETCYGPSVFGGFAIYDGYSSDLSKTGDILCSTGSSAGILFYGDIVTYPDGTTEPVAYSILPYPVFEGGEKIAIQRGNGLMVAKSDEQRETAAAVFLKWFTAPERNMRFVAETGYLPVTNEAFETQMPKRIETVENPYIRQLLVTVTEMYSAYAFFTAPVFEAFDDLSGEYESAYKTLLTDARQDYLDGEEPLSDEALAEFMARLP
jgi:multiple sugar transport system substrate-binding protein